MSYFAVTTVHAGSWKPNLAIREQEGWTEHARFMNGLVDDGFVYLGGPLDGGAALLIVDAADRAEVEKRLGEDPWAVTGLLRTESIRSFEIWLDRSEVAPGD